MRSIGRWASCTGPPGTTRLALRSRRYSHHTSRGTTSVGREAPRRRGLRDAKGRPVLAEAAGPLDPRWLTTYPIWVSEGVAPLAHVLADRLAEALGQAPAGVAEAVEHYLDRGQYRVATRAAAGNPASRRQSTPGTMPAVARSTARHDALLREAEAADDPDVRDCLGVIRQLLAERTPRELPEWLAELRSLVLRHRRRSDPRRPALEELLREAGVPTDADAATADLEAFWAAVQDEQSARRRHVVALAAAADAAARLPTEVASRCGALARRLDRPALWPAAEVADRLSAVLGLVLKEMEGKWKYRERDRELVDRLADRLGPASRPARHWREAIDDLDRPGPRDLLELAQLVNERCPDAVLLERLGAAGW